MLREIYKNIHTQLSKDGNEGLISEDRLNSLWLPTLYELIRKEAAASNVDLGKGGETVLSLKILKNLIVIAENVALTTGSGIKGATLSLQTHSPDFTYDFLYWGAMWTTAAYNGQKRPVTLVDAGVFTDMSTNMMKMNIDENPVAFLHNALYSGSTYYDYLRIFPQDIANVDMIYIKKPRTPFLDYYIDANLKTNYMDAGTTHTLTSSEEYRDGTTSGTKTSQTVELDIPEDFHPKYQYMLMEKISLPINDQFKTQYSIAKEQTSQ